MATLWYRIDWQFAKNIFYTWESKWLFPSMKSANVLLSFIHFTFSKHFILVRNLVDPERFLCTGIIPWVWFQFIAEHHAHTFTNSFTPRGNFSMANSPTAMCLGTGKSSPQTVTRARDWTGDPRDVSWHLCCFCFHSHLIFMTWCIVLLYVFNMQVTTAWANHWEY